MPKQKTRSTAKKRFSVKPGGKIKRSQQNRRHILTKKAPARKMALRQPAYVSKADEKNIRAMLKQ